MENKKPVRVFFVSSTLHLINAAAFLDVNFKDYYSQIWLIDVNENLNRLANKFKVIYGFNDCYVFLKNREENIKQILKLSKEFEIVRIYVGNDRMVEFQYLAYLLDKKSKFISSTYIDEGLYTYTGRSHSKRKYDHFIKKIIYGLWYCPPKTIGASKYIDEAYVHFPELAHEYIKKQCVIKAINSELYRSNTFIEKLKSCLNIYSNVISDLQSAEVIYFCTDKKNIELIDNYKQQLVQFFEENYKHKKILVKYHPDTPMEDYLKLKTLLPNIKIIPKEIPVELLCSFISHDAMVYANNGTSHIMIKIMRPGLKVSSLMFQDSKAIEKVKIYSALKIPIVNLKNY